MKILLALAMILAMNSTHAGIEATNSKYHKDISGLPRAEQIKITKEIMKKEFENNRGKKRDCDHEHDHDASESDSLHDH